MKIAFYGGQTAGIIVLLALLSLKNDVRYVIAEDDGLKKIASDLKIALKNKDSLNDKKTIDYLAKKIDVFICCHGRKILSTEFIERIRCVNIHPCLYKYKGARPVARLIQDGNPKASVASHWMTEKIDAGETIVEIFKNIKDLNKKNEADVYNELYPLYVKVIMETIEKISK